MGSMEAKQGRSTKNLGMPSLKGPKTFSYTLKLAYCILYTILHYVLVRWFSIVRGSVTRR